MHGGDAGRLGDVPAAGLGVARGAVGRGRGDVGEERRADRHRDRRTSPSSARRCPPRRSIRARSRSPRARGSGPGGRGRACRIRGPGPGRAGGTGHAGGSGRKSVRSSPASCRSRRSSQMSKVCAPTSARSSSSMPRMSRASRLSIRPQLVELATTMCPSRTYGTSRSTSARVCSRAGSNAPFDCSGRPQQPCGRDDHLEPVVLEHRDRHAGDAGLVVVGRAAVEVHDRARRRGRPRVPPGPRLERLRGEVGQGRVTVEAERGLEEAPHGAGVHGRVRDGRDRPCHPAEQRRAGDQAVAVGHPPVGLHLGPGAGVDLGDVDSLRAHLGADAAPRAVVQ